MKKIILLALVATALASCKKYPEGPGLSLLSKAKRIEGTYNVEEYTANGVNQLYTVINSGMIYTSCSTSIFYEETYSIGQYQWKFSKSGNLSTILTGTVKAIDYGASISSCYTWYTTQTDTWAEAGTWKLVSDKEQIQISIGGSTTNANIIELHNKRLQLEWTNNGILYHITLTQI